MNKTHLTLAFLLLIGSLWAADTWTLDGNGGVYWTNGNGTIAAYPAFSNGLNHELYLNSSNTGIGGYVNMSFVFPSTVTDFKEFHYYNGSRIVQVPSTIRQNYTFTFPTNNTTYSASTLPCNIGDAQNTMKYKITYTTNNTTSNLTYCFNSYSGNNIYYQLNETINTPTTVWGYDYYETPSSAITTGTFGNKKVFSFTNVSFPNGAFYKDKITYNTPLGTSGKFDIFAHQGSQADLMAGTAKIFLQLDPWWNSSYAQKRLINCSLISDGTPIVINGSSGFTHNGTTQIVWTVCGGANLSLYYNSGLGQYIIANDTAQVPMEVEMGNGTSYEPTQIWTGAVGIYHMASNTTVLVDSSSMGNNLTITGSLPLITGIFGKGITLYAPTSCQGACSIPNYATKTSVNGIWATTEANTIQLFMLPYSSPAGGTIGIATGIYGQGAVGNTMMSNAAWIGKYQQAKFGTDDYFSQSASLYDVWSTYTALANGTNGVLYTNTTKNNVVGVASIGAGATAIRIGGFYNPPYVQYGSNALIDEYRIYNGSKGEKWVNDTQYNALGTAGYGTLGASETSTPPNTNITTYIQTATNQYNGTHINYTITGIFTNPTATSQTVNLSIKANGTTLATSNNTTITTNATTTLTGNWLATRGTLDANFSIIANATGADQSVLNGSMATTITMILPIDPPSAINLMNNGGKTRCRTPNTIGYWNGLNWSINASWNCNYTNEDLTGQFKSQWCYQETANVSTACGGLANGSYDGVGYLYGIFPMEVYDGNWNSYIDISANAYHGINIKYSKPNGAVGAIWKIKDGLETKNITLDSTCWNANDTTVLLSIYMNGTSGKNDWRCNDINLRTTGWYNIYEEGIFWDMGVTTNGIVFVDSGTTTFSGSNITTSYFDRLAGDIGTAATFIFNAISSVIIR